MEEKGGVRVNDAGMVATPAPTVRLGDNAPVEIPQHRAAKLAAFKLLRACEACGVDPCRAWPCHHGGVCLQPAWVQLMSEAQNLARK